MIIFTNYAELVIHMAHNGGTVIQVTEFNNDAEVETKAYMWSRRTILVKVGEGKECIETKSFRYNK